MVFPALLSAGMALVDTADATLMLGAYGWAFLKLIRKLYYNLTINSLSVMIAILVGSTETLGLVAGCFERTDAFWTFVVTVNDDFAVFGYGIIGLFMVGSLISLLVYKLKRYETV